MNLHSSLLLCIHFVTILTSEKATENPEKANQTKFSTKPYKAAAKEDAKKLGKKALAAFNLKYKNKPKEEKQETQ